MAPLDLTGFRRGILWNKRHDAQHRAQWAYFNMQVPDDRSTNHKLARVPSIEEVPGPTPTQSGKRSRGEEDVKLGTNERSIRVSKGARHLDPHHRQAAPPDAVSLFVPTYERPYKSEEDWNKKFPEKKMGGSRGFQPMNTLGQGTAHSALKRQPPRQPNQSKTFSSDHDGRAQQQTRLELGGSKGSNVAGKPRFLDGDASNEPPLKRRRVSHGQSSHAVDLTEDYSQATAIPKRQVDMSSASQNSSAELSGRSKKKQSTMADPFGNNEMQAADAYVQIDPVTGRKLKKKFANAASATQQASYPRNQSGTRRQANGTAQEPVNLDDDEVLAPVEAAKPAPARLPPEDELADPPPFKLMSGVDEAGEEHLRKRRKIEQSAQGSKEDMSKVNELFGNQGLKRAVATQKSLQAVPNQQARPRTNTAAHADVSAAQRRGQVNTARLVDRFKRDDIEDDGALETDGKWSKPPPMTQPSSSRPQTRDHSPDVLDGDPTVRRRGIGKAMSPQVIISEVMDRRDAEDSTATGLTSSLKPTNIKQRKPGKVAIREPNDEEDIWNVDGDGVEKDDTREHADINTIICKGLARSDAGHSLVWDHAHGRFLLADQNKSLVYSPLQRDYVEIGRSAVSKGWQSNKKSLKVILKGSMNWMSNGNILLEFATSQGKDFVYQGLCDYAGMKLQDLTDADLNARFTSLGNSETEGFLRAQEKAKNRMRLEQDNELREKQNKRRQAEEDKIVYETNEPQPPRHTARTRMQSGTLSEVLLQEQAQPNREQRRTRQTEGETSSPYFSIETARRSTRQSKPPVQYREPSPELVGWTETNGVPKWRKSVVYPRQGPRRVTIDAGDIKHLDVGQFLNDNIVNYALREIEETMAAPHKDRVHFFNTFFYSSLTAQNGRRGINYDAVKKWTKNVDLLSKPYVVVPINLDLHWFVAIIYNLPAVKRKMLDSDAVEPPTEDYTLSESDDTPAKSGETHSHLEKLTLTDTSEHIESDKFTAVNHVQELDAPVKVSGEPAASRGRKRKKAKLVPVRKDTTNETMIISLDSFGHPRGHEIKQIKQYVVEEAREKRQIDVSTNELRGVNAKGIPQQDNFYDCGVYLIGYMKEFAKDPDRFVKRITGREIDDSDFQEFNTNAMREEYRNKLLVYEEEEAKNAIDEKKARHSARKATQTPQASETSNGNTASITTRLVSNEVPQPLMSSQPAKDSPSAQKLDRRHNSPAPRGTLPTSTDALRGLETVHVPTSSTVPASSYSMDEQTNEQEDDLEIDVPHTLPTARQGPEDEDEMLMGSDTPHANVRARESVAPAGSESKAKQDAQLSPLSSLTKDIRNDGLAGHANPSSGSPYVEIKEEDEGEDQYAAVDSERNIEEQTLGPEGGQAADEDIKSESDESDSESEDHPGPVQVVEIGDEADQRPLDEGWSGIEEDVENPIEIPESQEAS